jgi:hypothetical protein
VADRSLDEDDQSLDPDDRGSLVWMSQALSEMLAEGGFDEESAELVRAIARGDYRVADRLAKAWLTRLDEDAR